MTRGPKKHMKRLAAPKSWMLDKLGGVYSVRPNSGPHRLRESMPLAIFLRNRLKYALTSKEVETILKQRLIKIDGKYRSNDLIKTSDPDAPARQNRNLHDLDNRDDHEFAKLLYVYVRSGMLQAAQEICEQSGYPWRAGTLDGWKLFHDPNLTANVSSGTSEIKPTEGNFNRDLWKRVTLRMTQDADMNRYFLAAYSALCGNVNVLKSVCSTWEDLIWAYTNCLVDTNVELQIREILVQPLSNLPAFYCDNKLETEPVFTALISTKLNEDNLTGTKILHEVPKLLIINDTPNVLNVVDEWSKSSTTNEHEILQQALW